MNQKALWNQLSINWLKWSKEIYKPREQLHGLMGSISGIKSGDRYLDFATGMGEPALTIQQHNNGCLGYGVDSSATMIELATKRAETNGIKGVKFSIVDGHALPFDDDFFSAYFCCFGLEYVPDLSATIKEAHRVLKSGGALIVNVWGPEDLNPVQTVSSKALVGAGLLPSGIDIFRYGNPEALVDEIKKVGFKMNKVHDYDGCLEAESFAAYWNMQKETSPLIFNAAEKSSGDQIKLLENLVLKNCEPYIGADNKLRLPFHTKVIHAQKK